MRSRPGESSTTCGRSEAISARVPDRIAIVSNGHRRTYARLADRARRFAHVLTPHGLGHHVPRWHLEPWEVGQDFAGLYLLNGPEYLEATLGCYAGRVAPANINYRYVASEVAYLLDDDAERSDEEERRYSYGRAWEAKGPVRRGVTGPLA